MSEVPEEVIAGRYQVITSFSGGMGIVYLCNDLENENLPIALKTIQYKYLPDLESRERFLHEVDVWVELGWHPNIVQAFGAEYIIRSHEIYLALELIPTAPGKRDPSLRSWILPNFPMPIEKGLRICLDVIRGMKYATTKIPGLVHRDLKPENILLGLDGSARIADFGLVKTSKYINQELEQGQKAVTANVVGTPLYMSPEQWLNQPTFARSDIYSFGCIVYELITGELLISGKTIEEMARNHVVGVGIQKVEKSNVPVELRKFITQCVHPDALQRFQTWSSVESGILSVFDTVLHISANIENIGFDIGKQGQVRKGESLLALGISYLDIGKPNEAIEYFERAIILGKQQQFPRLIAACKLNIGVSKFNLGQFHEAINYYQQSIELCTQYNLIEDAVMSFGNIGNSYFQLGKFDEALQHILQAIQFAKKYQDKYMELFLQQNLANVLLAKGNGQQALELYKEITIFSENQMDNFGIAGGLLGMGIAYEKLGDLAQAETVLNRALLLANQHGDENKILACLANIGHVITKRGKLLEGEKYLEIGLSLAIKTNRKNEIGQLYGDLGVIHTMMGNFDKANKYLNNAIAVINQIKNNQLLSRTKWSIGVLHEIKREYADAIKNQREAVILFKELGLPEYSQASQHLTDLRRQLGLA